MKSKKYQNLISYDDLLYEEMINIHETSSSILLHAPDILRNTTSINLQKSILDYLEGIEKQQKRIEDVLNVWNISLDTAFNRRCSAINGIIADGKIEDRKIDPLIKDNMIALIFIRISQYMIASYSFFAKMANTINEINAFNIFSESMQENQKMYSQFIALVDNDTLTTDRENVNTGEYA